MALTALRPAMRTLAPLVLGVSALGLRLAAAPGADLEPTVQEILGRAPRLDAYWYTRSAVDSSRALPASAGANTFDRPLYTRWCRAVFAVTGLSERTLPWPAILAAALGVAVLVVVGRQGGLGPAAGLAGVFAVTNWLSLIHDREPLVYSTVNLAFLLSLLAWMRGLYSRRWFVVGWFGIAATAVWGKETVLLAVPALLVGHLLAAGDSRRERVRAAGAVTAVAGGAAALAWLLAPGYLHALVDKLAGRASFVDIPFPGGWIAALGDLPGTLAVIDRIPAIAVLAAIGVTAIALEGRGAKTDRNQIFRRVLVVWLVIGCAIVAGFSYRPTRYVLGLFAPAFLLAAHGARVLWGDTPAPVGASRPVRVVVLGLVWWIGLGAIASWVAAILPPAVRQVLPALLWAPAVRLGVAAALATAIATAQARSLGERRAIAPARRWAVALAAFVVLTDVRALTAHLLPVRYDDIAARRSFEAVIAPGARVIGYAADYLAFAPAYRVATEFRLSPAVLLENATQSTHLATLWVPELGYVERLMAGAGAPLHHVIDVEIGRERYRVYRFADAGTRGYALSAFEQARLLEERNDSGAAGDVFRKLLSAGASDPLVLTAAARALAGQSPAEGLAILERARTAAPRNGLVWLGLADIAAATGRANEAVSLRARAAALLPHELVLGYGPQPLLGAR